MDKKQGFFSSLKHEVVRGLSPARSRAKSPARSVSPMSGLLRRRRKQQGPPPELFMTRSGSLRPVEALSPLKEGPDGTDGEDVNRGEGKWGHWMKGQLARAPSVSSSSGSGSSSSGLACKTSDLRLLLGVLGAPLAPVHVCTTDPFPHLSIKDIPIVSFSLSITHWLFHSSVFVLVAIRLIRFIHIIACLLICFLFSCFFLWCVFLIGTWEIGRVLSNLLRLDEVA